MAALVGSTARVEETKAFYFPDLPLVEKKYSKVAQKAIDEFRKHYTSEGTYNFFAKAQEIDGVITAWTRRHDLVVRGTAEDSPSMETLRKEYDEKVTQYIAFRHIRDKTQEILSQNVSALEFLTLARPLDPYTIQVLVGCNIDVASIEKRVLEIFGPQVPNPEKSPQKGSHRERLSAIKEVLTTFHTGIEGKCKALRQALEPLARYTSTEGYGIGAAVSWIGESASLTPYMYVKLVADG